MTILAISPQSELVQIPIPTVFERSLEDEISAKMTYPSGPLFIFDNGMDVENPSRSSKADSHADLVDKVVDDRLGTYGGKSTCERDPLGEVTYKRRDGPLGILVRVPYPDESNQEQDNGAADHAPVEEEATTKTVDSVKGQQISDDLWGRVMRQWSVGVYHGTYPNGGHSHTKVEGIAIRETGKLEKVSTESQDKDHA